MEDISTWEYAERLFLALICGLLLGLDRDMKDKPVDFRVHVIVSVTACLVSLLTHEITASLPIENPGLAVNPEGVIHAVLLGIAFLGGATIIKRDDKVIGTATGASVWAAGAIGLTFGYGYYVLGGMAFGIIFLTLVVLEWIVPGNLKIKLLSRDKKH